HQRHAEAKQKEKISQHYVSWFPIKRRRSLLTVGRCWRRVFTATPLYNRRITPLFISSRCVVTLFNY
ncbi:hypothetical protein ACLEDV_16985, partial [Lonsdalea quercina]|uniref:hypothetical protein n=1 Tax=Lonsdalea quercina TaxID=71657 RepID=UPI003976C506